MLMRQKLNTQALGINRQRFFFRENLLQAVKPLVYTGIVVKYDVQLTARTAFVTYRRDTVLDVPQDGRAQLVTHV